jgi:hypothetical protein
MSVIEDPKQTWLLNYENPLNRKLGKEFFKNAPTAPGVYWMLGREGEILYIGKAKNLRNRLRSYQRAKPDQAPRKVLRLVYLLAQIQWEVTESEKAALLRENALLREHQPPFNVMNTHPETYLYIGFAPSKAGFQFCLSNPAWRKTPTPGLFGASKPLPDQEPVAGASAPSERGELFGAFKGRGMIRSGYAALLRLIWVAVGSHSRNRDVQGRFEFPSVLVRRRVPDLYPIQMRLEITDPDKKLWERSIRRFLKGTSIQLLEKLSSAMLEVQDLPPFYYGTIQEDLETLKEFYAYGPQRNRTLRRFHQRMDGHLIGQDEIDDLLVTYRIGERILESE